MVYSCLIDIHTIFVPEILGAMNFQKYRNLIIIMIFAVSVTTPLIAMILKLDRSPLLRENREHAAFPDIALDRKTLKKFPHDFYAYFRDNFGFRDDFIRLNFLVKRTILKELEFNDVLFGKDGWLYYLGEKEMDDSRGITHYDEETLARWAASLERKRQWLAARGIRYLFVIAPNKASIYRENLPSYFRDLHDPTGLDEFVQYVRAHTGVDLVDLRPALLTAKTIERSYMKTDTHWNEFGAFVAYQEIMETLSRWFPATHSETFADYVMERKMGSGGDLAIMVGGSEFIREEEIFLVPKKARNAREIEVNTKEKFLAMYQDEQVLPRALVFRDSFFDALIPFISEQFQYARFYRHHWDESIPVAAAINSIHPDVVIEEFVERQIKFGMGDFSLQ